MNRPSKTVAVLLPIVAFGAIGFAVYESALARKLDRAAGEAHQRQVHLRQLLAQAEARLARSEEARAARAQVAEPASQETAEAKAPRSEEPTARPSAPTDPKLRALRLKSLTEARFARLDFRLGLLLAGLNLSPDKIERFKTILLAQETEDTDILTAGLTAKTKKLVAANRAETSAQMKALLSPEEFATWQQFARDVLVGRNLVGGTVQDLVVAVAQRVYASDTPLTAQQGLQLTRILASSIAPDRAASDLWSAVDLDAAIAGATAAGLSANQIAALRWESENARRNREKEAAITAAMQRYPGAQRPNIPASTLLPR